MEIRKCSGLLACSVLLALVLISGCGGKSSTTTIPGTVTTVYAHTVIFRHYSTMTMGYNGFGQLGDGTLTNRPEATMVPGLGHMVGGATGGEHTLVFGNTSSVKAWGYNLYGQLGNSAISTSGTSAYSSTPVNVTGFHGGTVTGVAAGAYHSLAIAGGTVYGWGYNGYGQVGNGTFVNAVVPAQVKSTIEPTSFLGTTAVPATQVAAGSSHSLALLSDGTVYAWGKNSYGQLGIDPTSINGGYSQIARPVSWLPAPRIVTQIAADGINSYARADDNTVWAWGYNGMGELGIDPTTKTYSSNPVQIMLADGTTPLLATQISAGGNHVLARLANGTVMAWGFNGYGQLGDNGRIDSFVPVAVLGLPVGVVTDIIAFGDYSLAKVGNAWYGWGDNGFGQLGNPISTSSIGYLLTPSLVQGY